MTEIPNYQCVQCTSKKQKAMGLVLKHDSLDVFDSF